MHLVHKLPFFIDELSMKNFNYIYYADSKYYQTKISLDKSEIRTEKVYFDLYLKSFIDRFIKK